MTTNNPDAIFDDWWDKTGSPKVSKIETKWIKENEPNDSEEEAGGDYWHVNQMMHERESENMARESAEEVFLKGVNGEKWVMQYGGADSFFNEEIDEVITEAYEAGKNYSGEQVITTNTTTKTVKKKAANKKADSSTLDTKLEKIIAKDFHACEELLQNIASRNEWIEKNCKRMKSWQKAAEAGDTRGQVLYGLCFYYGHGVKENETKAVEWFSESAEQGNAQGQFSLGQCYYDGTVVEQDDKKAIEWYTKSAEQGNACAQWCLDADIWE